MSDQTPTQESSKPKKRSGSSGSIDQIPHSRELAIEFVCRDDTSATLKIPYKKELIGNPVTGTVHGGVVLSLIDSACGRAVYIALKNPETIATLDLRVDYFKPAKPEQDLYCVAECYKLTRTVVFMRAVVYQDDVDDPIASSVSTFMRTSVQ